ncbi:flavivirus RNA-directed RNA polymerase [Cooperia oncophora]
MANIRGEPAPRKEQPWSDLEHEGLEEIPDLPELDTSPGFHLLDDLEPVENPKPMVFLRETHRSFSGYQGMSGSKINMYSTFLMRELVQEGVVPDFSMWSVTDTTARETFKMVARKVDVSPVENHDHYPALLSIARGMVQFLKLRGARMRILRPDEIVSLANRKSGMGLQERMLATSMGDYLDSGLWRKRKKEVAEDLLQGYTDLGFFNSMGKKEKKKISGFKGSRLIWYLPATMRLVELENLGFLMEILKEFPFSVSGFPLYDYGPLMELAFQGCECFLADDVASWDTRISVGDLRIEHWMLQEITQDERQKKLITALYRIYANKRVMIDRERDFDEPGDKPCVRSLFSVRGQRGSGENVTYAMNTITNAILTYYKVAKTLGVPDEEWEDWTKRTLLKQRSRLDTGLAQDWMALISGDDSVIGVKQYMAQGLSKISAEIHAAVGKPRKDMATSISSRIYPNLDSVPFCSHYYINVEFAGVKRRMPVRSCGEILAKARIMLDFPPSLETEEAWARATGFQLLITYPHLLEIRLVALALLSSTRPTLRLEGLRKNPTFDVQPWLLGNDAVEVVNQCLFGVATNFPSNVRIRNFFDVEIIRPREYQGPGLGRLRKEWKMLLASRIVALNSIHGNGVADKSFFQYAHPTWIQDTTPKAGDIKWLERSMSEMKLLRHLAHTV